MKLHVGCGSKIFPGWTNLDIDDLPGIDIIDDARKLSKIPDESWEIIYACHILEHLGRHEVEDVLKVWNTKLLKNGIIVREMEEYKIKNSLRLSIGNSSENKYLVKVVTNIFKNLDILSQLQFTRILL